MEILRFKGEKNFIILVSVVLSQIVYSPSINGTCVINENNNVNIPGTKRISSELNFRKKEGKTLKGINIRFWWYGQSTKSIHKSHTQEDKCARKPMSEKSL